MTSSRRATVSSLWIVLVTASLLAVTSEAVGLHDGAVPFEYLSCFYAVGGGETPGSRIPQPQIGSPACVDLYTQYIAPDGQYWKDIDTAIEAAMPLLQSPADYSKMVTLDIDETSLSNLPLYTSLDFNVTSEDRHEWYLQGMSPAIQDVLQFYKALRLKGYSVVFITGRGESLRESTERNLLEEGYGSKCTMVPPAVGDVCYYDLIMKQPGDKRRATVYKSAEREKLTEAGFDIVAGIADQWSDILGPYSTLTLIKLPNPFYYIP